jgi:hypothetical protein
VLGVRPLEPGFRRIRIEPRLCGLKWAKGSVPTPAGRVDVCCHETDDCFEMTVTVPRPGITHIKLQDVKDKKIVINGKISLDSSIVI